MTSRTKVFWDMEFTGLHQATTPISIGLVSEHGHCFYAEFTDYDKSQIDDWLQENVMDQLILEDCDEGYKNIRELGWEIKGNRKMVTEYLEKWLAAQGEVEMWSDCLAYDWVLFCELFGGALKLPENIYYIPMDICTLFKLKGADPDISRENFARMGGMKHNALHDAEVIKRCYFRLMAMENLSLPHLELKEESMIRTLAQILSVKGPLHFTKEELIEMSKIREATIEQNMSPEDNSITLRFGGEQEERSAWRQTR